MSSRQPTPDLFADPSVSAQDTTTDPIVEATVAVELAQLSYDYRAIDDPDLASDAQAAAVRIKTKQKRAAADIIAIGEDLHAIKQRLPHGQFGLWIQVEFGMSDRTAQNYMLLATEYTGQPEPLAMLGQTVALLAARPSTPAPAKAALLDAAEQAKADGGKLTKTQAQAIVAEHKPPPPTVAAPLAAPANGPLPEAGRAREGLPDDLAAAGWELRRLHNDGDWWVFNRAGSRSTGTHSDLADAIAEAYNKQIDLLASGLLHEAGRAGERLPTDPLDDIELLLINLLEENEHSRLTLTLDTTDGYHVHTFDPGHAMADGHDSLAAAIDAARPVELQGATS